MSTSVLLLHIVILFISLEAYGSTGSQCLEYVSALDRHRMGRSEGASGSLAHIGGLQFWLGGIHRHRCFGRSRRSTVQEQMEASVNSTPSDPDVLCTANGTDNGVDA